MPIYEFKCRDCGEFFEILVMSKDAEAEAEAKCPKCESQEFERVLSATNHAVGASDGGGGREKATTQTRNCSAGNCTTYTIPGGG
ncbi:MAG: zinc ribbon domain-containing protein [Proteobacteria bacterium]|nr:zinc ribbon domain-containing protein [Pseudomonadota bacterium]